MEYATLPVCEHLPLYLARNLFQILSRRVPGAGSFLRPSANICHGKSFLEALKSKYIEQPHGAQSQETVVLGSSQGTIQVEAVNLDKVRSKLSNLSALREVSLDGVMVAVSDSPGAIGETCPSESLDPLDESHHIFFSQTSEDWICQKA
jgi:hypothetical protein